MITVPVLGAALPWIALTVCPLALTQRAFPRYMNHHRRAPRLPDRHESFDSEAVLSKNKLRELSVLRLHIVAGRASIRLSD
jgi:hypothetical protein